MKNGIILLNKPIEISSNTAVNKVKRLVKAEKAGHLGTLDVLGEGILPITLGKATRLFNYFLKKDKTYRAIFAFGIETTTLDCEGEITNINLRSVSKENADEILGKFKGKISQLPPQYSALKINGQTAYNLARKGEHANLKAREIEIYDIKLLNDLLDNKKQELKDRFLKYHKEMIEKDSIDFNGKNVKSKEVISQILNNCFEFEITCSAGTYIRSLCRDIAKELTTCGVMLCIVRTRCGKFNIENAVSFEDIENGNFDVIDVENAIDLPSINLTKEQGKDILDGKKVKCLPIHENQLKLYCGNVLFGIANNKNEGIIKVETFLKENN